MFIVVDDRSIDNIELARAVPGSETETDEGTVENCKVVDAGAAEEVIFCMLISALYNKYSRRVIIYT